MAEIHGKIEMKVPVVVVKEGDMFVAHCSFLDVSTCGATFQEAQRNLLEAIEIFFEECLDHGTLDEALASLGWHQTDGQQPRWEPPVIVGQDSLAISIPN